MWVGAIGTQSRFPTQIMPIFLTYCGPWAWRSAHWSQKTSQFSISCSNEHCKAEKLSRESFESEALLLDAPCTILDERRFNIKDRIEHFMLEKYLSSKCSCGNGNKSLTNRVVTRTPLLLYISCAKILSSSDEPTVDSSPITITGFH